MTYWDRPIQVIERGNVPVPRPGSRAPLAAIGGGTIGLAIGGPVGGFIGLIIGGIVGAIAEAPLVAMEV